MGIAILQKYERWNSPFLESQIIWQPLVSGIQVFLLPSKVYHFLSFFNPLMSGGTKNVTHT